MPSHLSTKSNTPTVSNAQDPYHNHNDIRHGQVHTNCNSTACADVAPILQATADFMFDRLGSHHHHPAAVDGPTFTSLINSMPLGYTAGTRPSTSAHIREQRNHQKCNLDIKDHAHCKPQPDATLNAATTTKSDCGH